MKVYTIEGGLVSLTPQAASAIDAVLDDLATVSSNLRLQLQAEGSCAIAPHDVADYAQRLRKAAVVLDRVEAQGFPNQDSLDAAHVATREAFVAYASARTSGVGRATIDRLRGAYLDAVRAEYQSVGLT